MIKNFGPEISRPRVCFLISTSTRHARGGHYWDLAAIAGALTPDVAPTIVNIGAFDSPVLQALELPVKNIHFTGQKFVRAARQLVEHLRLHRTTLISVMDVRVYWAAAFASLITKVPLILTKCGGPNPGRLFPAPPQLVVFSEEDLEIFQSSERHSATKIWLIPNRTSRFEADRARIERLKRRLDPARTTFLMICRLNRPYLPQILQARSLVRRLNESGVRCQLVLIGTPEDPEVADHLRTEADSFTFVVTDDEFTMNARELLEAGDFVVATGRGLMEAAAAGRPLLTPLLGHPDPLLLSATNFNTVFRTNFSLRNVVEGHRAAENFRRIRDAVLNLPDRASLSQLSRRLFTAHFDIETARPLYLEAFRQATFSPRLEIPSIIRQLYRARRTFRHVT